MFIIKFLYVFFSSISEFLNKIINFDASKAIPQELSTSREEDILEKENSEADKENQKINITRRTLLTKLYLIEQRIDLFKEDFPQDYGYFLEKIENLRKDYKSSLDEITKPLTLEVDPEINGIMNWKVSELDDEITMFIEKKVKFEIFSQKLQRLISKLNILYNVSISHPNEKVKVIAQAKRAVEVEMELTQDLKQSAFILSDRYLKDRLITLISYVDYQIFKIILRNSNYSIEQILAHLVIVNQFKGFDYISTFRAFMQDEISDIAELLDLISDEEYHTAFDKNIENIISQIICDTDTDSCVIEEEIWRETFKLESNMIEFLKSQNGVEQDKIKVKIFDRMEIHVNESEVLTSPKTCAYLALIDIFSITHDDKIWLLIRFWTNISDQITYKEIYFLLLLFDAIDVIKNTPNTLNRKIEKYFVKYPYNSETIKRKKMYVLKSSIQKKYVKIFPLDEQSDRTISILKSLNIDFKVENSYIYMNSFYFNGLKEVFA